MSSMYEQELYHHGIMGMHWGVRRYQNYDGTLTSAGRRRLNKKFHKGYNAASERFNRRISEINSKEEYQGGLDMATEKGQRYLKEVDHLWRELYVDGLKEKLPELFSEGSAWVDKEFIPFMSQYTDYANQFKR